MTETVLLSQVQGDGLSRLLHSLSDASPHEVVLFAAVCAAARFAALSLLLREGQSRPWWGTLPGWTPGAILIALGVAVVLGGWRWFGVGIAAVGLYLLFRARGSVSFPWLRVAHDVLEGLQYAAIVVFLIIRPFLVQTFEIPSPSMEPTLRVGDYVLVDKASYRFREPRAGEIAVFRAPTEASTVAGGPPGLYVKRLIAGPGDVVEVVAGILYRNGVPLHEPHIAERDFGDFKLVNYKGKLLPILRDRFGQFPSGTIYLETVPPKDLFRVWDLPAEPLPSSTYFALGDNRNNSMDSRHWGLVNRHAIVGRAWVVFFPLNRWGVVR
ncbi:MAG: signal peptidase I [Armatimonadota bacterium]